MPLVLTIRPGDSLRINDAELEVDRRVVITFLNHAEISHLRAPHAKLGRPVKLWQSGQKPDPDPEAPT